MRIPDATERKTLVLCFGIGGLICSAPGDFVAAGALWVIAFAGYALHRRLLEKEAKATAGGPPAPLATDPAETAATTSPSTSDTDEGKAA